MAGSLPFIRQLAVHHDLCDSSRCCQRHTARVPFQSPFLAGPSMRSRSSHDISGGQQSLCACSFSTGAGGYNGLFTIFGIRLVSAQKSPAAFMRSLASARALSGPKGSGQKLQHTTSLAPAPGPVEQSLRRNAPGYFGSTSRITSKKAHRKDRGCVVMSAGLELAGGIDIIGNLGLDSLTFLIATVVVVPAFKAIKASPILGFLLSGVVFNQLGLIRNVTDVKALSELGVLFLLFEMGLELSIVRLKALAKYALGIGLAQVLVSTLVFTAFELPTNNAVGTRLLEFLFHARPDLVNIRTVDEAVVIGAGLSLSSSAFVLQLLAEKGELPTRFGSATLGILLLQDIAVVPLLVILPILETGNLDNEALWPKLAAESLKALLGLGVLSLGGRILMRRFFEVVANSRSTEAFVALCLLTVTGTSLLTQKLGFSDTLGAFLAGALLAETNYKTQVEADIRPFRGLLLGLFFVTTGTSIDLQLLYREWPNVLALLGGLIAIKTAIISIIGPRVGLTIPESVRTGLLLSQGGEFAFVVFSLANKLGVLPNELNRLLIIVVVLSMALTPLLNEVGRTAASYLETKLEDKPGQSNKEAVTDFQVTEPVVIIGFGQVGQVLANFLSTPLVLGLGGDGGGWPYVAFDLDPGLVRSARNLGFPVLYGDGSRPVVLQTAGITSPKAVLVLYTGRQKSVEAVQRMRASFPTIPIYGRSQDLGHLLELKNAGATDCILETTETSLQLGSLLLRGLGVRSDDVRFLRGLMRESMELRAREALEKKEEKKEGDFVDDFQAKVRETWTTLPRSERGITWARQEYQDMPSSSSWQTAEQQPPASSRSIESGTASSSSSSSSESMKQLLQRNDGVLGLQTSDDELPMRLSSIDSQAMSPSEESQSTNGADGRFQSMSRSTSNVALTSPESASHSHGDSHDPMQDSDGKGQGQAQDEQETTNGRIDSTSGAPDDSVNGGVVSEAFTVKGSGSGSREDIPSSSSDESPDNKSSSSSFSSSESDQSQTSGPGRSEETPAESGAAPEPSGLAILRLKYRDVSKPLGKDDARGVTLCTLPGDSRFKGELEFGEKVESIDETIKYSRD